PGPPLTRTTPTVTSRSSGRPSCGKPGCCLMRSPPSRRPDQTGTLCRASTSCRAPRHHSSSMIDRPYKNRDHVLEGGRRLVWALRPSRGPMSQDSPTSMMPAGELEIRLTDTTDRQVIRGRLLGRGFLTVGRRPNAQVVLPATDREAAV